METQNVVYVKQKSTFWTVVKVLLVVAGVCLIAARIYQKIRAKTAAALLEEPEEVELFDDLLEEAEVVEDAEEAFEVPAEAVIANAEDME